MKLTPVFRPSCHANDDVYAPLGERESVSARSESAQGASVGLLYPSSSKRHLLFSLLSPFSHFLFLSNVPSPSLKKRAHWKDATSGMRALFTAALGVWLVVLLASNSQSKPFNLQEVSKRSQLRKDRQDRADESSGRLEQSQSFAIRAEGMANPIVHTCFEKRGISKNDEESEGSNEQVFVDRTKEIPSSDLNKRGNQVSAVSFNGLRGRGNHDRYARPAEGFFKRADNDGGGIVRKTV